MGRLKLRKRRKVKEVVGDIFFVMEANNSLALTVQWVQVLSASDSVKVSLVRLIRIKTTMVELTQIAEE